MSQENIEVVRGVRTPVTVQSDTRRRTLDERIFVLIPALARIVILAFSRLPPRSRLRQAWLSRVTGQASEAVNRRDFELLFLGIDPEVELRFDPNGESGLLFPDLLGVHRGREAYRRVWNAGDDAWDDLKFEPREVIDFGDRLIVAGRITGRGRHSGIDLDQAYFQVMSLRRGLVIRQEDFADREKALEAAGLRE